MVVLPLLNIAIDTPQAANTTGVGYSDMYVQPLQLGWHKERYDALVGHGLFLPTGRFKSGALNNHGLGMWSHELSVGTTISWTRRGNGTPLRMPITTFNRA